MSAQPQTTATRDQDSPWTPEDAAELYRVDSWGAAYYHVNEHGHAAVWPNGSDELSIDIAEVVADLRARGVPFPVLIRFQDVLQARVKRVNRAFATAIEEAEYDNVYRGVYPIKVNQLHEVVEEVLEAGQPFSMGLECGSKPELIAALPHMDDDSALLICNGVKDATMLRLILSAQRLGKPVIPVLEKYTEFVEFMRLAAELAVVPRFGVRVRLTTAGSGRWRESGGDRSKFGLSIPEIIKLVEMLESRGHPESLELLHFHLGSQIADIQILKQAVKEITQVYAQLRRRGVPVTHLDVGGGLGVNYDVGYSSDEPGISYSLQEYANAVVYSVQEVCEQQDVPQPTLVSESGRALVAHHSILIVEVLGAYTKDRIDDDFAPADDDHATVQRMYETWQWVRQRGGEAPTTAQLTEAYHDVWEGRNEADTLFALGYLELEQKALAERLYWSVCHAVLDRLNAMEDEEAPAELLELEEQLVDHYLCDFSVFQSILDHWAIGQGFPIMPIDRLDEQPTRRALLVDLTCDSDGKVSHYVSANDDKRFMPVHALREGVPYDLGFFLMGAYQDIMGDAHNLFGRVAEAHIYADAEEPGNYYIEKIIPATSIRDMLASVQYFPNDLQRRMNHLIRQKVEAGVIRPKAGTELLEQYMRCFDDSTYFDTRAK